MFLENEGTITLDWMASRGSWGMRGVDGQRPPTPRRPDDVLKRKRRQKSRSSVVLARFEAPARGLRQLPFDEALGALMWT